LRRGVGDVFDDAHAPGDGDCIADYSFEIIDAAQAIEIICAGVARWTWNMTPARAKKSVRTVTGSVTVLCGHENDRPGEAQASGGSFAPGMPPDALCRPNS
jgi:hypothetical protein